MDMNAEVAILSIFGRGHSLAAQLARQKVPVALLDLSSQMGSWEPEDIEGPFGFFDLHGLEREFLDAGSPSVEIANGFTLCLSDGPLEMRGPNFSHRWKVLSLAETVRDYLQKEMSSDVLRALSFPHSWPAQLAHYMASPMDSLVGEAHQHGLKRNLLSPFFIRQVGPEDLQKSLNWCESQGVRVLRNVELVDLSFEEKKLAGVEIRTDKPQIFKANQFVVGLTAEECTMLGAKIRQALFPEGIIEPEWAWLRYRIQMRSQGPSSEFVRAQIPSHCLVLEDVMLPWCHENFMILQKPGREEVVDVWVKVPNHQRFHSQYLSEQAAKLIQILTKKFPENDMQLLQLPKEAESTFEMVGPARHPVYPRNLRSLRKTHQWSNISIDSPEYWKSLSWEGRFEHQSLIYQELKAQWDRKEELRMKKEAKEAAKRKRQNPDAGVDT